MNNGFNFHWGTQFHILYQSSEGGCRVFRCNNRSTRQTTHCTKKLILVYSSKMKMRRTKLNSTRLTAAK